MARVARVRFAAMMAAAIVARHICVIDADSVNVRRNQRKHL